MHLLQRSLLAALLSIAATSQAALTIPGADGSDGSLHITANTVIDLSQAPTATWDTPSSATGSNGSNAGNGVYDAAQWAVVFKYSSVTVDAGATLTFVNHPSRAPVVWLVSGNVDIQGTVSVNGANGAAAPGLAEPGPGGFRGGMGYYTAGVDASPGFGPGGANFLSDQGAGGSYGSQGNGGPATYGNPALLPLLGGSGGGGDGDVAYGGGGGGGALLIACGGTLAVNGSVLAKGGNRNTTQHAGGGSGGAVRLVANALAGSGAVSATGGLGYKDGGVGRIRVEHVTDTSTIQVTPSPSVVPLTSGSTALIWPPNDAPQARIVSIGGAAVGDDPRASFGTDGADAVVPETTSTQVLVETTNVEQASQVQVRVTPRMNTAFSTVNASVQSVVSTNPLVVRWAANIPVQVGYSAVQVKVIRP